MSETDGARRAPQVVFKGVWAERGTIAVIGGGALAVVGYLSLSGLAAPLHVAASDLVFDRSVYVLFAATYVVIGLVWFAISAVACWAAFETVVSREPSKLTLIAALASAFVVAAAGQLFVRSLTGWQALATLGLQVAAVGALAGVAAAWPGEQERFRRWWVAGSLVMVSVLFFGNVLRQLSVEGRELAEYATALAQGDRVERPSSLLSYTVSPVRGVVDLGDGELLCVVRVSDRVYLLPPGTRSDRVETMILQPRSFTTDHDC